MLLINVIFQYMTEHHSFHINCGGDSVNITDNSGSFLYEGDGDSKGSASINYVGSQNWGYSSTGDYLDDNNKVHLFTISNSSKLSEDCSDLYMTARKAPTSLIYYGFCLENGKYTVRLHFAEIEITDKSAYSRLGQRIFDIYIQVINYGIIEYGFSILRQLFDLELFDSGEVRMEGFQYHGKSKWNW